MKLSDHDLLQLTEQELLELPEEVLRRLSIKLLVDLKEARERLKQTSRNSSRPPSSDAPWSDANNPDRQADATPPDEQEPTDEMSPDNDGSQPCKKKIAPPERRQSTQGNAKPVNSRVRRAMAVNKK